MRPPEPRPTLPLAVLLGLLLAASASAEQSPQPRADRGSFLGVFFHPGLTPLELEAALGLTADQMHLVGDAERGSNVVWGVFPQSPAAAADIQPGDLLVSIDGKSVRTQIEIDEALRQHRAGDTVTFTFLIAEERRTVRIDLAARPNDLNRTKYALAVEGLVWAQWGTALNYYYGRSTTQDFTKARYWAQKVAEAGPAHAKWFLGRMCERGEGGGIDLQQARNHYEDAAARGHVGAQYQLGLLIASERGPENEAAAVRLITAAADQGHADSQFLLGLLSIAGAAVPKNEQSGLNLMQRAASAGHPQAQACLAALYFDGVGAPRDYVAARRWAEPPAKAGLPVAQTLLGMQYHFGLGVQRDDGQAAILFASAAEKGFAKAQAWLGSMYRTASPPDFVKARQWLLKAAEQGDGDALYNLGIMSQLGQGSPRNDREAFQYYHRAALTGHAAAQAAVGVYCLYGGPVAKSEPVAKQWFELAAGQGDANAQFNLGVMFASGLGVAVDQELARQWYEKAAEQGHLAARYNLGKLALRQENYPSAAASLHSAAEKGLPAAQTALGTLYQNGLGVPQSRSHAIAWYLRAYRQGEPAAGQALESLGLAVEPSSTSSATTKQTAE